MRAFSISPCLEPAVVALTQLTPASQEIVLNLIRGLAEREDVQVAQTIAPDLQLLGRNSFVFPNS